MHFIEEDLDWLERGIDALVLIWEIETYLAFWAEVDLLYPPNGLD